MAKISGGKNSRFWFFFSAKKVLLTAEKLGFGPKMAKIQCGVKPDILECAQGCLTGFEICLFHEDTRMRLIC